MPDAVKMTLFFAGRTNRADLGLNVAGRSYGITESYYYNGSVADAISAMKGTGKLLLGAGLASARASILPEQCSIVGFRAQLISTVPPGPSISDSLHFAGQDIRTDLPQVSLLVRLRGTGVTNVRRQLLRCIPDEYVVDGEYFPSPSFRLKIDSFISTLGSWAFRAIDASQPKIPVATIDINGLLTTTVPHAIPLGATVKVGRGRQAFQRGSFSGTFKVVNVPSVVTLQLAPSFINFAVQGGYVRRELTIYPAIESVNSKPIKSAVKKVGRPFDSFIGRAGQKT